MRTRILLYSVVIILISVAVTASVSVMITVEQYLEDRQETLFVYSTLVAEEVAQDAKAAAVTGQTAARSLPDEAARFAVETGCRVTFIARDGTVLGDSVAGEDYYRMDNHLDRTEVAEALRTGRGSSDRESPTFGREFLYAAVAAPWDGEGVDGGDAGDADEGGNGDEGTGGTGGLLVTRLAMEVDKFAIAAEHASGTAAASALIGVALGIAIAILYTRRLTRPIREMERQLANRIDENMQAENIRKDFVANVTHELKTPLTSIAGFAETLQGRAGDDPDVRRRFVDIISIESARLARLIDDILILSDIEREERSKPGGSVEIKQAIEEVLDTLRPLAEEKGIGLSFEVQYEMFIGGEKDRFKQLMVNLIENAIKYSPAGTTVTVRAEKAEKAKRDGHKDASVCVSVRDEGIGIAPEDIPRLFERFYRVDKSRSKEAGGTGLGLAIVKHIALLFDAEIAVESTPGEGSVFTVCFPAS
jgi:signal transduction histidine kinase